ncbi:hypothetical protein [Oligosphaera ethanolica]|uniref:Uncharacterized protein n=1 Tax=Oligosphaera ethanolica TaxID=760260 RepID=A0AAE4AQ23_9BACT|nr:hypothetical protein [Oligosphaera ethanolica]MDQ0290638.1 hypothetical protein [Oligosphaera ethanolica]
MKQQVPWIPLNEEHRFHRSNHPGGEYTGAVTDRSLRGALFPYLPFAK